MVSNVIRTKRLCTCDKDGIWFSLLRFGHVSIYLVVIHFYQNEMSRCQKVQH